MHDGPLVTIYGVISAHDQTDTYITQQPNTEYLYVTKMPQGFGFAFQGHTKYSNCTFLYSV